MSVRLERLHTPGSRKLNQKIERDTKLNTVNIRKLLPALDGVKEGPMAEELNKKDNRRILWMCWKWIIAEIKGRGLIEREEVHQRGIFERIWKRSDPFILKLQLNISLQSCNSHEQTSRSDIIFDEQQKRDFLSVRGLAESSTQVEYNYRESIQNDYLNKLGNLLEDFQTGIVLLMYSDNSLKLVLQCAESGDDHNDYQTFRMMASLLPNCILDNQKQLTDQQLELPIQTAISSLLVPSPFLALALATNSQQTLVTAAVATAARK